MLDEAITDYGPTLTKVDGRLVQTSKTPLAQSDDVEVGERLDPGAPNRLIRGSRRRDYLEGLYITGEIDKATRDAAERFRDDNALAAGVRSHDSAGKIDGACYDGMPISMIDAQTQVRKAWLAIRGNDNDAWRADVVRCIVLGSAGPWTYDKARRVRNGFAKEKLLEGLERLVDFYSCVVGM